jgi:hypothetical protein
MFKAWSNLVWEKPIEFWADAANITPQFKNIVKNEQ